MSFGNSVHAALAQYNHIQNKNNQTLGMLQNLLKKNWVKEGYRTKDESQGFGMRGLKMLENYFNEPKDKGKKVLIVEEMIKKKIDDDFIFCGKIDKAFINEEDKLEVLDYKTGNNMNITDDVIEDPQLPLYILLVKERIGEYPKVISYYYLATNTKISFQVDEDMIAEATDFLTCIMNEIKNEKDFLPAVGEECSRNCEYCEHCKAVQESTNSVSSVNRMAENYANMSRVTVS